MKYKKTYKQALAFLVAINFGCLWAAVDQDEAHRAIAHAALYRACEAKTPAAASGALQTTLNGRPAFTFIGDTNLVRSLETGYYMRRAMLGLEADNLSDLVKGNQDFFKTSLGASLLYMWMAKESGLFYIAEFSGPKYRFANVHDQMADRASADGALQVLLKNTCKDAEPVVQAEPLTFLGQILHFPHEFRSVG
jgi:hypothetical protein